MKRTENVGGTDASFPVSFARVDTGMMRSDLGAGGCFAEDWKNVACSVARGHPFGDVSAKADRSRHTRILPIQTSLEQVVELEDERAVLGEQRDIARHVLEVGPDDAIPASGFGC